MYFGNLPEEYLFVLIDTEDHSITIKNDKILELGLSGALLMELVILGKISLVDSAILILDPTPVEDEFIEKLFSKIRDGEKNSTLYWIREFANDYNLKDTFLTRLEEKNLIEIKKEKQFLIFTTKKYQITKPEFETIIRQHIRDLLDSQEETNHRALGFLSLIYATGATGEIFTDEEIDSNIEKIRSLVKDEKIGKSITESIEILIDALMRSQILNYHTYLM